MRRRRLDDRNDLPTSVLLRDYPFDGAAGLHPLRAPGAVSQVNAARIVIPLIHRVCAGIWRSRMDVPQTPPSRKGPSRRAMKKPREVIQPRWRPYLLKRKAERLPFTIACRNSGEAHRTRHQGTRHPRARGWRISVRRGRRSLGFEGFEVGAVPLGLALHAARQQQRFLCCWT
jgi:hypothetical protein